MDRAVEKIKRSYELQICLLQGFQRSPPMYLP